MKPIDCLKMYLEEHDNCCAFCFPIESAAETFSRWQCSQPKYPDTHAPGIRIIGDEVCLKEDWESCPLNKEEEYGAISHLEILRQGRKEVVECVIHDFHFRPIEGSEHHAMWQAKLKEWGIEE